MSTQAEKMIPIGLVLGLIGYCCWPYAGSPSGEPEVKSGPKIARIPSDMLAPAIDAPSARDPFRIAAQPPPSDAAPKSGSNGPAPGGNTPPAAPPPPPQDADRPLTTLVLNATFLQGNRRVALINNRLYSEGDTLQAGNAATSDWVVAQIESFRVVLAGTDQQRELNYSNQGHRKP
jgi:hypothetical protein